jgi:diamine N-acetyltransferase
MIHLRALKPEDASGMLEWLNDFSISQYFTFAYKQHDLESVYQYIYEANHEDKHHHYAIANEQDQYLGTISLKNIDQVNGHAEYAIAIRKSFHGQGIGEKASRILLELAKVELKLHKVYLSVLTNNQAAIHLYEKLGFKQKGLFEDHVLKSDGYQDLNYYEIILNEDAQ